MATGDPYFNCNNSQIDTEQVFRKLIYDDGNGNPVVKTGSTSLQPYFNCERRNQTLDQVLRSLIVQDENGDPALNITE